MSITAPVDYEKALYLFNNVLVNLDLFNLLNEDRKQFGKVVSEAKPIPEKTDAVFVSKSLLVVKDIMFRAASDSLTAHGILFGIQQPGLCYEWH